MRTLFPILFVLFPSFLFSQKESVYLEASELIESGITLYEEGSYDEALAYFSKIHSNDRLFPYALYEKALCYYAQDKYEEALLALDSMKVYPGYLSLEYYNNKGNILDDMGRSDEAIALYSNIYPQFEHTYLIAYNYALCLYKRGDFDHAEQLLETALRLNPFHFRSHLMLGSINYAKGRLIPALICYSFAANMAYDANTSFQAISFFESAYNGILDEIIAKETKGNLASTPSTDSINEPFSDLEYMVKTGFSANKKFKYKAKINYTFARQLQLIIENLQTDTQATDLYNQLYIPFLLELHKLDYTNSYIYKTAYAVNKEDIQKTIQKNKAKINTYISWAKTYLEKERSHLFNSQDLITYTFNRIGIESRGIYSANTKADKEGIWTFYNDKGTIEATGNYKNNLKQGKWNYYYPDGKIFRMTYFVDDLEEGEQLIYHENGSLSEKSTLHKGKLQDTTFLYNESGNLKEKIIFLNGRRQREDLFYFNNGNLNELYELTDDKLDGRYESYYENKTPSILALSSKGLPEGTSTLFFENGQIRRVLNFKNGILAGEQRQGYPNGKTEKLYYTNDKGMVTGSLLSYYSNGDLESTIPYNEKGEENSIASFYKKGKQLDYIMEYKKGRPFSYIQYNDSGEEIKKGSRTKDLLAFVLVYPDGTERISGLYKDNTQHGLWIRYYKTGIMKSKINFQHGAEEGEYLSYFQNGKVYQHDFYVKGKSEGPYKRYHINGMLASEGHSKEDNLKGEWNYYYFNGQLQRKAYFDNGFLQGKQTYFHFDGKKEKEEFYENGYLTKLVSFREDETSSDTCFLKNGNGRLETTHPNGETAFSVSVLGGKFQDTLRTYNYKGVLTSEGEFTEGLETGIHRRYNESKVLIEEISYILGKKQGICKSFDSYGNLSMDAEYLLNKLLSINYYHTNGIKSKTISLDENEYIDTLSAYGEEGNLQYHLYSDEGVPYAYAYMDKNKQLITTELRKGSGEMITYYPNGTKAYTATLTHSLKEGPSKTWHENGTVAVECNFVNDNYDGEYKRYSAKGVLLKHVFYKNDELNGLSKTYYDNAIIKSEEVFLNGYRHGACKYYNKKGILVNTCMYYHGTLLSEK